MSYYLAVLGSADAPVYELDVGGTNSGSSTSTVQSPGSPAVSGGLGGAGLNGTTVGGDDGGNDAGGVIPLRQFIVNAALDLLHDAQTRSTALFFRNLDSFNGHTVHAFLTQGNTKIMVLAPPGANVESVRLLCVDLHDLLVKWALSPFHKANSPITDKAFDVRARGLARKYLL